MVTKEEITRVAKLMRIEITDHDEHIEKVEKMIKYFDILDQAGVEDEEIDMRKVSVEELRDDVHIPFDDELLQYIKRYKEKYVRAPKMI